MKRNKRKARFGEKWWDRFSHFSSTYPDGIPKTSGSDEFGNVVIWPRMCRECEELFEIVTETKEIIND